MSNKQGYHIDLIEKGSLGDLSKILEEVYEAIDAEKQNCSIMVLLELSDVIGAIELYLNKHHPNTSLEDLKIMSNITQRAFESGQRRFSDGRCYIYGTGIAEPRFSYALGKKL